MNSAVSLTREILYNTGKMKEMISSGVYFLQLDGSIILEMMEVSRFIIKLFTIKRIIFI